MMQEIIDKINLHKSRAKLAQKEIRAFDNELSVEIFEDFEKVKGNEKIAVVGLGYVGLPLAVLLNKKFNVVGYDISKERIEELKKGVDKTREVEKEELLKLEKEKEEAELKLQKEVKKKKSVSKKKEEKPKKLTKLERIKNNLKVIESKLNSM